MAIDYLGRMTTAHHEAAHAVIALTLGGRVPELRMWFRLGEGWHGNAQMQFEDTTEGYDALAHALLAGTPAEFAWLRRNNISPAQHPNDLHAGGGHDRDEARELLARIPRDQRPAFRAVERRAELLVERHWDRIEHLADRLIRSRSRCLTHVTV